ncbi:autotransporter domain-containing protein, partial [uncultured Desulfovibrio sp.]|uniref:autotransporter domain-containing protein n=1 Tax=uncultured Desulfovibrio sp. TaxID=167968 RepID=UPI0026299180
FGNGNATKNTVTINGSAFNVYGGQVSFGNGNATKNTVTINGSAVVEGDVYGGHVSHGDGNATKNTVTINGSAVVEGYVYGGHVSHGDGNATDNTLSISGAPTLSSCSISGGFSHNGDAVSGNLLELRTSNLTVKCIQNFAAYAFVLPATIQSGDVLLTATDAIDLTNSGQISSPDFQRIDVTGDTPLSVGDTVTLLQSDAGLTAGELRESVSGSHGVTLSYTFKLTADGNAVVATVMGDEDLPPMDDDDDTPDTPTDDDTPDTPTGNEGGASVAPRVNPQTKALAEGYLSGVALTLQGADLVAGKGIDAAGRAVRASLAGGGKGLAAFGALSGGWSRYNTGSHIDVSGFSLLTGLAWGADSVPGQFTAGMFFEYGSAATGTYNSFSNAASVSGDGSTWYMGAGLLARMDFNDSGPGHIYAEASARAGALNNKYRNDDLRDASGRRAEFDTSTPYVSLHAGLGYVWDLTDALSLDLSAKYFWTWQDSADSDLSTGEALHFDAVNSHRLRLGGRLTWAVTEHVSPYVGAAWEHEFDGKARATSLGYDLDAPSLTGDTGIGELGLSWTPSATIPLTIDLSLQGYTGVREGYTGSLMAKWEF